MKRTKKATKGEAVFLLVAGLIIGTVFTFGVRYWNAPITEDEAQLVTGRFDPGAAYQAIQCYTTLCNGFFPFVLLAYYF